MKRSLALLSSLLAMLPAFSTTVWKTTGTGGWNDPNQWNNGVPSKTNPAKFENATVTVTDETTDEEWAIISSVKLCPSTNGRLIFDISTERTLGDIQCTGASGVIEKKGTGTLFLSGSTYSWYGPGRIVINDGAVKLTNPYGVDGAGKNYVLMEVNAPGKWILAEDKPTSVAGLEGDGTVTRAGTTTSYLTFMGDTHTNLHVFSGILETNICITVGDHRVGNQEGLMPNQALARPDNGRVVGAPRLYTGYLAVQKFGEGTEENPGSLGWSNNSDYRTISFNGAGFETEMGIRYLGEGETTARSLFFDGLANAYPVMFHVDAGSHGNLTCTGSWRVGRNGNDGKLYRICFEGDGPGENVMSGTLYPYSATVDAALVKRGQGTWYMACGSKNTLCGPVFVEGGTLACDTLAAAGTACALGKATLLTTNWCASAADCSVPYAIKLGNGSSDAAGLAALDYRGDAAVRMSTRDIALDGAGALIATNTARAFTWNNITALESGGTLVLDGGASGTMAVSSLSDGEGPLSVEKRGAGICQIAGANTFTGKVRIREGVLIARGNRAYYSWFRLTFKNMSATATSGPWLQEIALYDVDGVRQNVGLSAPAGSDSWQSWNVAADTLAAGCAGYGATGSYKMSNGNRDLNCCFDDANTGTYSVGWNLEQYPGSVNYPDGTEARYWKIVMHLTNAVPRIAQYDFCGANVFSAQRCPVAWSWEGSHDGSTWHDLGDTAFDAESATTLGNYKWLSDGTTFASGRTVSANQCFPLDGRDGETDMSPLGTASVQVDPGATLKANGSVTVSKIVVDATTGAGTLDGVTLAESGTIDCVGVAKGSQAYDFTIGSANETDLAVLADWTLTANGKPTNRTLAYRGNGRFRLSSAGLVILFR